MKLDKAALAAGDRNELLKLARTIKLATRHDKGSLASQFFPDDGAEVRPLDLDALVENLAGAEQVARNKEIEDSTFAQAVRDAAGLASLETVPKPRMAGDVSQIGARRMSGGLFWPSEPSEKAATTSMQKARLLKAIEEQLNPNPADSAILAATIKSIVTQLLGLSAENFDPSTLKAKLSAAIKARPDLGARLTKALGIPEPDVDVSLEELARMGARITKTGSTLHISV